MYKIYTFYIYYTGMCPGLGEWWLHKGVLNLRNLISMLKLCLGFLVDTLLCVKRVGRPSIFIRAEVFSMIILSIVAFLPSSWQTSQLSRFGCETYGFSHDFSQFHRNITIHARTQLQKYRSKCHVTYKTSM